MIVISYFAKSQVVCTGRAFDGTGRAHAIYRDALQSNLAKINMADKKHFL
jgi:hypothetical protein